MSATKLLIVGGFLGAGKTTLLSEAARQLVSRGHRVGLITNDQAPNLVDTRLIATQGYPVQEVAGSCFCCNFDGFTGAAGALVDSGNPDVILAEPVGSCTDLSATILQPLKDRFGSSFSVTPLSVLVDPARLRQVLTSGAGPLHPDAAYICYQQLEEADVILINKADLLSAGEITELTGLLQKHFPDTPVRIISAKSARGVTEWLEATLAGAPGGNRIADVDYDRYAHGEAVLGWLNGVFHLTSATQQPSDWQRFCQEFLDVFKQECACRSAEIGHLKLMVNSDPGVCLGNVTSTAASATIRNTMQGTATEVQVVINARVEMSPDDLELLVRQTLHRVAARDIRIEEADLRSLSPGRPSPTHRYVTVVPA